MDSAVGTTPLPSLFLPPNRREVLEVHRGDLCARQRWFGDPSSPCGCFFDHSSRGPQESKTGFVALAATRRKKGSRSQWERGYRLYNRWLIASALGKAEASRRSKRLALTLSAGAGSERPF